MSKVENDVGPQTTGIDPGCTLTTPNTNGSAMPTAPALSPHCLPALSSDVKESTSSQTDVKPKILQQHIPHGLW